MKKYFIVLIICLSVWTSALAASVKDISSGEAKAIIEKTKNIFLLDVRTVQEWNQAYIPGSTLIPMDVIEKRIGEIPKNRPVIVYCAVGSRSGVVAQALSRQGYKEVYNMRDGIMGWYRNGYPVKR